MTVLELPQRAKIRASTFDLVRPQAINLLRNGDHQIAETREPFWAAEFSTTELDRATAGKYKLLQAKMGAAFVTLLVYDPSRPRPLAYHSGGSWGSPMLESVSREDSTLSLSGFVPGAVISPGDYGAWLDGPTQRLHMLGGGVADGSGNLTTLCEPPPPTTPIATLPVPFTMEKPAAEMVLAKSSVRFLSPVTHEANLSATQVLRRS